jgi:ABC-type Fe3+/spermidine/putrescine transport system ATPase subunit
MPGVRLEGLTKRFGKTVAIENINLDIQDGEILTFLGPSGCGKTTTLRCIAGLLIPDEGDVYLGDERVTNLPPEKRKLGLVFQNYALWPHMTVFQNLAFGLELRKVPKAEIRQRIEQSLALVRLSGLHERFPRQLSGGQQQRVALARALVLEPRLLLLDEPLSNLDAQLREEMRFELRELQKNLGITSVYVTHDQAEALVLSDRIAILQAGELVQVAPPSEIYSQPGNRFVAGFVGLSSFMEGTIVQWTETSGQVIVRTEDGIEIRAHSDRHQLHQAVTVAIRPEHIQVHAQRPADPSPQLNILQGAVQRSAYLGDVIDYRVQVGQWVLRTHTDTDTVLQESDPVFLTVAPDQVTLVNI